MPSTPLQDEFAAGVVEDLSGDGVEVNARLESANRAQVEGQEVEEQGSFRLCCQRDHLAFLLFGGFLVDELQIRRFTAQPGAVVNDLAVDLPGCKVDETQDPSSKSAADIPVLADAPHRKFALIAAGFIPQAQHYRQVTGVTRTSLAGRFLIRFQSSVSLHRRTPAPTVPAARGSSHPWRIPLRSAGPRELQPAGRCCWG